MWLKLIIEINIELFKENIFEQLQQKILLQFELI